jgi:hypothetical protein
VRAGPRPYGKLRLKANWTCRPANMSVRIDRDLISEPQRKIRKHLERASEYVETAGWLIKDFFDVARWQLLPVLASGFAHIGLKFAAMGVIYVCVHALSQDSPITIPGMAFLSPKSPEFVVLSVGAGVVLLIGTAFFRYEVRRRSISVGRHYEEHCARRVILLASRLPDRRAEVASRIVRAGSLPQYPGYARVSGMAARQLTQLLPAVASFLAVSLALLWMDAGLTVTLAALAAVAVLAQYPANHRVATASKVLEGTRHAAGRRYRALFRRLHCDPMPLAPDGALVDQLFRSGHVRDNIDSVSARAAESEQAALVSRISSSMLLGGALILLGIDIVQGERTWAAVVTYAAAVRFALSDFVSVCKIASSLTKYHAQITKHREFVIDALPCLRNARQEGAEISWPIELRLAGLHDQGATLTVQRGDVLALVAPGRARYALPVLFEGRIGLREGHEGQYSPVLVDSGLLVPDLELRANIGLPSDLSEAAIERALAPFVPEGEALSFVRPGWLDHPLELSPLPQWTLIALHVLAVRARRRPLVAMDLSQFAAMSPRWRDACRIALAESVLILIHARPNSIGRHGEQAALMCDGEGLCGWLPVEIGLGETNLAAFHAQITQALAATGLGSADEPDEDDDEEE